MCYDGVLVMPREFAVMDEEEMTYVEGGISSKRKWWGIQVVLSGTEAAAFAFGETAFGFVLGAILRSRHPYGNPLIKDYHVRIDLSRNF